LKTGEASKKENKREKAYIKLGSVECKVGPSQEGKIARDFWQEIREFRNPFGKNGLFFASVCLLRIFQNTALDEPA
jgi:hypothetical protein